MNAWAPVALALIGGWGLARWHRRLPGAPGTVTGSVLWGVALVGAWLLAADAVGVRWTPIALALPALLAAGSAVRVRPLPRAVDPLTRRWGVVAAIAVGARAAWVAAVPAFGWDFRYVWGLKAKVFALAGGHDFGWLAWAPNVVAHPDYPPLWSDLIAAGVVFGGDPGRTAAAWQALLVVGIAAACWEASAPAPMPVRTLSATLGGWAPVIFTPTIAYSGYAEPLLAFAATAAVGALPLLSRRLGGAWLTLVPACAILTLTKNEGAALAVALVLAVWATASRPAALAAAGAAAAPLALWRAMVALHGVQGYPSDLSPAWVGDRIAHFPGELAAVATPTLVALLLVWGAALTAIGRTQGRGIWIVVGVWASSVVAAYLTSPLGLDYMLRFSLDRELVVLLPVIVATALKAAYSPAGATAPWGEASAGRDP